MSLTVNELCKKYNLDVEPLDDVTFKVRNTPEINIDDFVDDIGDCSMLTDFNRRKIKKKTEGYWYRVGKIYAFTLNGTFNSVGINYKNEVADSGVDTLIITHRDLPENNINTIY